MVQSRIFSSSILPLFFLLFATSAFAQLPSQDILALLEFRKGVTVDPTGYVLDSWNEESIDFNGCPSSWNGIVCNGGNVAGVILDNLGLVATTDLSTFANLTMLLRLSMANNSISGTIPKNIASSASGGGSGFRSLKYLDVSNNLFTGLIPEDVGKLRALQNLSLSGNNFTGPVPKSFGMLISILSLDLSRNSLTGPLPSSLTSIKTLVSLNLSHNAFTGRIPTGFETNSALRVFDLSGNRFDGGIDWAFLMQSSVVHVDLSSNQLISLSTKELKFLADISETLKYLNLSNNQLTGSLIDGGTLSTFGNLKALDLSYNQLTGELPGFNYVYDLEVLRLGNNQFSGFLPDGLLKGDSLVLTDLDLSANNLSGHINMITSTTLQFINLSSNHLSGDLPLVTGRCTILDLSQNLFTGNLSVLSKWSNDIEYIDLSHNQLTSFIPDTSLEFLRLNYLNLSHNSLSGTLPDTLFASYPKLTILDLSSNKFSGPIPARLLTSSTLLELHIADNMFSGPILFSSSPRKSSLQVLDLSGNQLNGSFPDGFSSLTALQVLDVSRNGLSGPIPVAASELISLTSLDLSMNRFSGPLPDTLPNGMKSFNASYNDFTGVVPFNLRKFPDSCFHPGNSRLVLPGVPPGSSNASPGGSTHKPIKTGVKVIVIVSCVVAVVVLVLVAIILHYRRISRDTIPDEAVKHKESQWRGLAGSSGGMKSRELGGGGAVVVSAEELMAHPGKGGGGPHETISPEGKGRLVVGSGMSPSKTSRFSWSPDSGDSCMAENFGRLDVHSPDRLAGDLYFLDDTIVLTPEELSKAPAEVLGRSSHGTSYRATLDNGLFLTVKWLREGVAKPKKEFAKEAKKFANIRHPNVVGLRGYYWGPTQHEKLILSDFISPGSLASFLYDRPGRKGPPLTWAQRLKIAVDVARGLNYLHFDRALPHGNLKATNILLDGLDLNARVADYCLHRLMTQAGTIEQILDSGVLGYRAPELAASKKPSPSFKSDVYAFGVVLLELLTGRCAGDVVSGVEGGVDLTDWVRLRVAEGRGSDCFDPVMASEVSNPSVSKGLKEVLGIALRCIRPVSERPGIKSVYEDLSSI